MRNPDDLTDTERLHSLIGIMSAICVAGMAMGLAGPLYSFTFELAGYSRTITGFNAALFALAIILAAPYVPVVMRRFGTVKVLWIAMAVNILCLLVFRATENVFIWFATRFVMGLAVTALFVATEVWINLIAREESRGRVLGFYTLFLSAGFTLGIVVLYFVGSAGWAPILVTVCLFTLASVILIPSRDLAPKVEGNHEETQILGFLRASPTALTAAVVFGAMEMGILNLLNVYGLRAGLSEGPATLILISVGVGNFAGPVVLGYLADLMDRRILLLASALTGAAASLLIPVSIGNPMILYGLLFITGAVTVGLYSVGLTVLGERFKGQALAGANAAFVTMYGFGALFGPAAGGVAMDIWDPNGLMVVFFALSAGYALMVFGRIRRRSSLTDGAA